MNAITQLLRLLLASASLAALLGSARAETYSLAGDFTYAENNADSLWSFRMDDFVNNPPTFLPLLDDTSRDANVLWGVGFANPPQMWSEGGGYWGIGKNTTGVEQAGGGVIWAPDEVLLHPKWVNASVPTGLVICWKAPRDMLANVHYSFRKAMGIGNGVGYELVTRVGGVNSTVVAFNNIGSGITGDQTGLLFNAGDEMFFRIDCWGNAAGDITGAAIEVTEVLGSPACDILTFGPAAVIDQSAQTIVLTVPFGTTAGQVAALAPTFTLSAGATCNQPNGGIPTPPLSTTAAVTYTVTAQDTTTTKDYAVTVAVTPPSSEKNMLSFGPKAIINGTDIAWTVPYGTNVATLAPTYTVSTFATGSPASGVPANFTNPVIYTVTAEDGSAQNYTVTVIVASYYLLETFDDISGLNINNTQFQTGLPVGHSGSLADWNKLGAGTIHAVERSTGHWAPMFYSGFDVSQANVLTLASGIPANATGVTYTVSFEDAPAVYGSGIHEQSQATAAGDKLRIRVLNPADAVVASYEFEPGAWANPPVWKSDSFAYIGDGTGDVRFVLEAAAPGTDRFAGTLDNLMVALAAAPSTACDILTFGPGAVIDQSAQTIIWSVPFGTTEPQIAALAPTFTLSGGATCHNQPNGGIPSPALSTTAAVTYTVTAQDTTTTKDYAVTVVVLPPLFEDFAGISGLNINAAQYQTGLPIGYGGALSGWNKAGAGTIHAVQRSAGNWAPMFYSGFDASQSNVLTLATGIAANAAGVTYTVSFEDAPAAYGNASQATAAGDKLRIRVLNPSDALVGSYDVEPGAWAYPLTWKSDSFAYIGDGTGDVRFELAAADPGTSRFAGAIDNLLVTIAVAPSTACEILSFGPGAVIDQAAQTITWSVPFGTTEPQIAALAPTFTLSGGATCHNQPNGGIPSPALSSTAAVTYTVTAQDAITTKSYAVTVVVLPPLAEDFDGIGGLNVNAAQYQTGLPIGHSGSLPGWSKSGAGTIHAVQRSVGNWAPMFYSGSDASQVNVLTLSTGIAANTAGVTYTVSFEDAPATYSEGSQATTAGDKLRIRVLNPSNGLVASYDVEPGAWSNPPTWKSDSFTYVGDGSGDVRFELAAADPGTGRFSGAIDNLVVEPGSSGGASYSLWAATNAPGQSAGQDYDSDGTANGIEYFMGVATGDLSFTAQPGLDSSGKVTWPLSPTFSGSYQVQSSPDLSAWTDRTNDPAWVTQTAGSVVCQLPAGAGGLFVRLVVTPD